MKNLIRHQGDYIFRIDGGEPRSSCVMMTLILLLATVGIVIGSALLAVGGFTAWLAIPAAFALAIGGARVVLRIGRKGRWAPYECRISPERGRIAVALRRREEPLFDVSFDPDSLYLAPLKLPRGDAGMPRMALAYSASPHAPVSEGEPSAEHVVLATGREGPLYELAKEIQEAFDRARSE